MVSRQSGSIVLHAFHKPLGRHTPPSYLRGVDEDIALSPEALQLHLEGFEGPLDLLLDLARRQRVDLAKISIVILVDQYVAAVSKVDRVNLARAAEWLVMAAWLTWLKSRLLLPKEMEGSDEAKQAAGVLTDRLAELGRVRAVTDWLEARPQLGRNMFERSRPEITSGPMVAADFVSLFQACLDVLRGQSGSRSEIYRPPRRALWTPYQAIARMQAILGKRPEGGDLLGFLPEIAADLPDRTTHLRVAISSTLVAGLELARDAQADLQQHEAFGRIMVQPSASSATDGQAAAT
jgi:segregation and condensation protein A